MIVDQIMQKMQSAFVPEEADGLDATFQFCIADDDDFYITIKDSSCKAMMGAHDDPTITMLMDTKTLSDIIAGELEGMAAFMGGRLQAEGDVMLGARLSQLFEMGE